MRVVRLFAAALSLLLLGLPGATPLAAVAEGGARITALEGSVTTRGPKEKDYRAARSGEALPHGARLRTGRDGNAKLRFADGTEAALRPDTEIVVRLGDEKSPNGAVLFFGRLWSKVAKAVGAKNSFEVHSANAVAGVRGTQLEVGVAADGSARVIVSEGLVAVSGDRDDRVVNVGAGFEVESRQDGAIADKKKASGDPDWDGWFAARARKLEKQGLAVAKDLDGRLARRRAKVEELVGEQRALRKEIEALEQRRKRGEDVDANLRERLARLERVTERLVDMRERLEAGFGLFARWGEVARGGGFAGAAELKMMADDMAKVAADFGDMIEEGTDLSEEGMEETLRDMRDGPTLRPKKKSAKDELF